MSFIKEADTETLSILYINDKHKLPITLCCFNFKKLYIYIYIYMY